MNMIPRNHDPHYDAIIVGARCAGAATALNLARRGARVLLVDRDIRLHDTLSTHVLMRPAVTLLAKWGLLGQIAANNTPGVTSTRFVYGTEAVDIAIKPDAHIPALYAPRRWLLDRILREATVLSGATLRTGVTFDSVVRNPLGRVVGARLIQPGGHTQTVKAGVVIGADGVNSSVARAVQARTLVHSDIRSSTVYTYVDGVENKGYRWFFDLGMAAGLVPTTDGAHCVFATCKPSEFKATLGQDPFRNMVGMLSRWEPDVAAELARRGPKERLRRYLGIPGHLRECAGPGWALVGDAGYFKDPGTAHGITDAFLDATRLARAFAHCPGNLKPYQAERDHYAHNFLRLSQEIGSLSWSLERLQDLHMELHACMKAEAEMVIAPSPVNQVAYA